MSADSKAAYLPPSDYLKLRLMAEAACYEAGNEIVAALAEIDRLRAEKAALLAFLQMEYGTSEDDAMLNASAALAALNAPYVPDGDA